MCVRVCVCSVSGTARVRGLLLTGTGRCDFALDIMMGNRSVVLRSFMSLSGAGFKGGLVQDSVTFGCTIASDIITV